MSRFHIRRAARVLFQKGIITYPTEAVFGIGCLPENAEGVFRILKLKSRPLHKGLILVAADSDQIDPYIIFPDKKIRKKVLNSWPGPITWILPARKDVPYWIRGMHNSLAVRVSDHQTIRQLCQLTGAIISTSANPANKIPAKTSRKVRFYFKSDIDYVLPGNVGNLAKPTEIRDALSDNILRKSG